MACLMPAECSAKSEPGIENVVADEALLRRCRAGDTVALHELLRRYEGAVRRFLMHLLGSLEDAEDASVETFVRIWKGVSGFENRSSVSTWIYTIALNVARDSHRRRGKRPQEVALSDLERYPFRGESAETHALFQVAREEEANLLYQALTRLSESDHLVLVLYYLEECEYEEISAITGLSYSVLKTRLMRARRRLRDEMTNSGDSSIPPEILVGGVPNHEDPAGRR